MDRDGRLFTKLIKVCLGGYTILRGALIRHHRQPGFITLLDGSTVLHKLTPLAFTPFTPASLSIAALYSLKIPVVNSSAAHILGPDEQ